MKKGYGEDQFYILVVCASDSDWVMLSARNIQKRETLCA